MTDKELGLLLINAGYVTQEDILVNLQEYFAEIDPAVIYLGGRILPV